MRKGFRILIVEDSEDNYELLQEFINGLGYQVVLALNGLQAIEKVQNDKDINLVLMDIKMPVMNGEASLYELRKINYELPVIAVTAYALAGDKEFYLEKGFNDYVSKPINLSNLKMLIEKYAIIN